MPNPLYSRYRVALYFFIGPVYIITTYFWSMASRSAADITALQARNHGLSVSSLTILEAATQGLFKGKQSKNKILPAYKWHVWGQDKMLPVGNLPMRGSTLYQLHTWTFGEWARQGMLVGLTIEPLQDPLYYKLMADQIYKLSEPVALTRCSLGRCGRAAVHYGCQLQKRALRLDLCRGCFMSNRKRGMIGWACPPFIHPAAWKLEWLRFLRQAVFFSNLLTASQFSPVPTLCFT